MDIKTNLRDDSFLFPEGKSHQQSNLMVDKLNRKGIFTVEDLINCDQTIFNNSDRYYFEALTQILKYNYLGEELVIDVLLEKDYVNKSNYAQLTQDLRRLGFGHDLKECRMLAVSFLHKNIDNYTMEEFLKSEFVPSLKGNADFKGFYLSYLEEKRKREQQELFADSQRDVLNGLKLQLQGLCKMRDGIDKKIQDIQKQIEELSGGYTYGRK